MVDGFAAPLPAQQVAAVLRRPGKGLPEGLVAGTRNPAGLTSRAPPATGQVHEHLGALTPADGNGAIVIRGAGCPLAAVTGTHRGVCLAIASLVAEIVGVPVRECCEREGRPQCCFEIERRPARRST